MIDFVVTGQPRSGTHMVRSGLNQLPAVHCWDELFNNGCECPDKIQRARTTETALQLMYRRFPAHDIGKVPQAIGCLLQDPIADGEVRWEGPHEAMLRVLPDIRVIRVERGEALARYVSAAEAEQTGMWHLWCEQKRRVPHPIRVDTGEMMRWLLAGDRRANCHDYVFAEQRKLVVHYADLVSDFHGELSRMCAFLDQPEPPPEIRTESVRTGVRPLRERVTNLQEVVDALAGTRWACTE